MADGSPIDEGAPSFTIRVGANQLTVVNQAAGARCWTYDPTVDDEVDFGMAFIASTDLHDNTRVDVSPNPGAAAITRALRLLNALSYHQRNAAATLKDIAVHQAHCGQAIVRMVPNGDGTPNQWTVSSGLSSHYTYVDELADAVDAADYLYTTAVDQVEELDLPGAPSNAVNAAEALVTLWMAITRGTDTGLAIEADIRHGGGAQTRLLLAETEIDGTTDPKQYQMKFNNMGFSAANWATAYIKLTSRRGAPGGAPNPLWRMYAIEIMVYFEVNDVRIVDTDSFDSMSTAYSSWELDFCSTDGTYMQLMLDVIAHAPPLLMYMNYIGQLRCSDVQAYADVSTPIDLTPFVKSIRRVDVYRERTVDAMITKWGVSWPTVVFEEDPNPTVPDRGARRTRDGTTFAHKRGISDAKELDRHFIRTNAVRKLFAAAYLNMWGEDVETIEVELWLHGIEAMPRDVVTLIEPTYGWDASKKWCVVAKDIDLDSDVITLLLYDVEYTL